MTCPYSYQKCSSVPCPFLEDCQRRKDLWNEIHAPILQAELDDDE